MPVAVISAPGVADVRIILWKYGAGSFKVLVIPSGNRVPVQVLELVRRNVESVAAFGMYFTVTEPRYRRISMVVGLVMAPDSLAGERDAVRTNVEAAILKHLGDIQIGGTLVMTALGAAIRASDERVFDYRIDALCIDGKNQLVHNVSLRDDELFLPDSALLDAIKVI